MLDESCGGRVDEFEEVGWVGMSSGDLFSAWVGNELVGIQEWVVVSVFGAVVKGEPGLGLFDKGASLIASNKGITFSILVMGNLDYLKRPKQSTSYRY